jgi:drug/metabolite transporter (DMT)-like permease
MSWMFLSILAALLWSVVNIFDKYIISKLVEKPILPIIVMETIGMITSAAIFTIHGFQSLSLVNILLAIIAGNFYTLMTFFYFHAIKIEELSKVIPLFYLTPLFISIIAAFFLGEIFTPPKYLGVILLVAGAMILSSNKMSLKFNKAFWFMILASFVQAINQVITKYLLNFADFWTVFGYIRIGAFAALTPLIIINLENFKSIYKKRGIKPFCFIIASESLNMLGILSITLAAARGFITLVNALSSLQPLFVLLLTLIISALYSQNLKEEIGGLIIARKIFAILMMFVGVVLIS